MATSPFRGSCARSAGAATLLVSGALWTACAPGPAADGAARSSLATRYVAIAVAGNRRLEHDVDGFAGRDRADLVRMRADLADEAATEREFDRRLLSIAFPPAIETTARALVAANKARATLTTTAAGAASLSLVQSFVPGLEAANGAVEVQVKAIRRELGLPPPETS
ncbi:MAG: hypothetical protein ACREPI_09000 [Candidatus Dormibacterales bacterium]